MNPLVFLSCVRRLLLWQILLVLCSGPATALAAQGQQDAAPLGQAPVIARDMAETSASAPEGPAAPDTPGNRGAGGTAVPAQEREPAAAPVKTDSTEPANGLEEQEGQVGQDQSATEQTTVQSMERQAGLVTLARDRDMVSSEMRWQEIEPGINYAEIHRPDFRLIVVQIDPEQFDFVLCSAGREKSEARTLSDWGEAYDLAVAINASMYLPDGITSTGHMRDGDYINNKRIVQRFGAFFAAGPDDPDLPRATILERDSDLWQELLSHYRLVVQNYRIINSQRRILWSPGGPLYSISAIAMDGEGNILFLHSKDPVEAYTFAQELLHLPLNIRTVMYVEGGGQAGLLIRSQKLHKEIQGRHPADFLVSGNRTVRLPNVLGARRAGKAQK